MNRAMPQKNLHSTQVTATLEQRGGERYPEHVRIKPVPGFLPTDGVDAVIRATNADSSPGVLVDNGPDAARLPERLTLAGDKQCAALAGARGSADSKPVCQQRGHWVGKGQPARGAPVCSEYSQPVVVQHAAQTEPDQFAGGNAGFVQQPHDDMVPKADKGGQIRRGQQSPDLALCEQPGQPFWCAFGGWQQLADIVACIAVFMRPAVKHAQGSDIDIERGYLDLAPPGPHPLVY